METTEAVAHGLIKLQKDVELIKNILMDEGELTDWAKKQLKKARSQPEATYLDLDDL